MNDRAKGSLVTQPTSIEELGGAIAQAGSRAVSGGLVSASGGNISARRPGATSFVITTAGAWLDALGTDTLAEIDLDGTALSEGATPSSEWRLHARIYESRDDVNAIVHLHPQHAVLLDAIGVPLRLTTLDQAYYVRDVARIPYSPNGSDQLAEDAAAAARTVNCIVMSYHGSVALGPDLGMAYRRAVNLEEAAIATYRSTRLGHSDHSFPAEFREGLHHD